MVDCVVCQYWSERLEETRTHGYDKNALDQERRLRAALRTHQNGACASRFPELLRDLVMQELELPENAPDLFDPLAALQLRDSQHNEFGAVPTYE